MISVNRVYKTVLALANSDIRGNVTPTKTMLFLHDVVNEIYEEYFSEITRLVNRENRGLVDGGLYNLPEKLAEKVSHFLKPGNLSYSSLLFSLPADLRYFDTVYYDGTNLVEFYKDSKEFHLVAGYPDTAPTNEFPIGLKIADKIKILPASIVANVSMYYLRNPIMANWTYQVLDGAELFDPSASDFRDIDLHVSEENNVIMRTLLRFGVTLKEAEIVAFTQNKDNQDFNQENAN